MSSFESSTVPIKTKNDPVPLEILSKPSSVIKSFNKTITIAETTYEMTLVTMKRSFLFVINTTGTGGILAGLTRGVKLSLMENFMKQNQSLKGLSLAIGGHSTCMIDSENSVASLTLASRLSKALNDNGPVYVANNLETPEKLEEIYRHIFQFVRNSYRLKDG